MFVLVLTIVAAAGAQWHRSATRGVKNAVWQRNNGAQMASASAYQAAKIISISGMASIIA